jgi:hypothetical protein
MDGLSGFKGTPENGNRCILTHDLFEPQRPVTAIEGNVPHRRGEGFFFVHPKIAPFLKEVMSHGMHPLGFY